MSGRARTMEWVCGEGLGDISISKRIGLELGLGLFSGSFFSSTATTGATAVTAGTSCFYSSFSDLLSFWAIFCWLSAIITMVSVEEGVPVFSRISIAVSSL